MTSEDRAYFGPSLHLGDNKSEVSNLYIIRARPILLRHRAPEAIVCLVACRPRDFAAAGARFLRACLERRNPGYVARLVRGDLFAPVLAAYPANAVAGNPIGAEVLGLVDFIVEVRTARRGKAKRV